VDERGRFNLNEMQRRKLQAIWSSPDDKAILLAMKKQSLDPLYHLLRACDVGQISYFRAQVDILELFFRVLEGTADRTKEAELYGAQTPSAAPPSI